MKKSEYKYKIILLEARLATEKLKYERDVTDAPKRIEEAYQKRDEWRAKYETLLATPEAKVETEGAFLRGEASARRKLSSFLMDTARNLQFEEPNAE